MKENIRKLYRTTESFERYSINNKERVKEISKTYNKNKKYFGKSVLDIACGGGILGHIIEKDVDKYVGIDINPDMIKTAKETISSPKTKFYQKDVSKRTIEEKFDTITLIGNSLGHINTHNFAKILKKIENNSKKGTYFILDYRDIVKMLYENKWKDKIENKEFIIKTTGIDLLNGKMNQEASGKSKKSKTFQPHAIWSPFIIEPLMNEFGWELVKRRKEKEIQGWSEVYKKE